MPRKIPFKVFAGPMWIEGQQTRVIVASTSWKKVAEILGYSSISSFKPYWSITGQEFEIDNALSSPETAFYFYNGTRCTYTKGK